MDKRMLVVDTDLGGELPLITKILINTSMFFQRWYILMIIVIIALVIGSKIYFGTEKGRLVKGRLMLTLPVLWDWMIDRGDEDNQTVMNSLASIMRLGDPRMGSRLLRGILYDLEMEIPPLPEDQMLDALADSVNPERLGNHPMKLTRDDLRRIYVQAFLPPEENVRQACLDIWKYYGGQDRG